MDGVAGGGYGIETYDFRYKVAPSMKIQNSNFSGFNVAVAIGQPMTSVNITNVDTDGCGIYFDSYFAEMDISNTRIRNSSSYSGITLNYPMGKSG